MRNIWNGLAETRTLRHCVLIRRANDWSRPQRWAILNDHAMRAAARLPHASR